MDWIAIVAAGLGGTILGVVGALVVVARDPRLVKVPVGFLVVKQDVFEKLSQVASVRQKNPRLKFDRGGFVTGVGSSDDDESVPDGE